MSAGVNQELYERAQKHLVAGVGASGRFNGSLNHPVYFQRGDGAYLWDVDGRRYLDLHVSHGAAILGHNHPAVRRAIEEVLDFGVIPACETKHTIRLAETICRVIPCAERVRYLPSGTEVTMVALRLARAYTGRPMLLKFDGHFHGMNELVYYGAQGGAASPGAISPAVSLTAGVPPEFAQFVSLVGWNDVQAFDRAIAAQGERTAAVILEPVCYTGGCIPPDPGFLDHVRKVTADRGIVLIFDEILSGFRTDISCMQGHFGVTPDLCTLAKAVSNGVPLAVLAGRADIMDRLAPHGPVAQSGTYSGHQLDIHAALATLGELQKPDFYPHIHALADRLYTGLSALMARHGITGCVQGMGSRFGIYFGIPGPVRSMGDTAGRDKEMLHRFLRKSFERGIYFQAIGHVIGHWGFSGAHTLADIDWALEQFDHILGEIKTP